MAETCQVEEDTPLTTTTGLLAHAHDNIAKAHNAPEEQPLTEPTPQPVYNAEPTPDEPAPQVHQAEPELTAQEVQHAPTDVNDDDGLHGQMAEEQHLEADVRRVPRSRRRLRRRASKCSSKSYKYVLTGARKRLSARQRHVGSACLSRGSLQTRLIGSAVRVRPPA